MDGILASHKDQLRDDDPPTKVARYGLRHSPVRALYALWRSLEAGGSAPFSLRPDGKRNIFGKCPKAAWLSNVASKRG
jgi:hypothetical protein